MQTEHLKVTGMTCGGCAANVTHALDSLPGVSKVEVTLATGETAVHFDEKLISSGQLISAVQKAGYGVAAAKSDRVEGTGGCCA